MIKTFCDCCGVEIKPVSHYTNALHLPASRTHIEPNKNPCNISEDFLVELIVSAKIFKPRNLIDDVKASDFVGSCICEDCIIETLIQRKRK